MNSTFSDIKQDVRTSASASLRRHPRAGTPPKERRRHGFVHPSTPLLWAIRDHVGLTGTKYGCGAGLCGACTIHIDGTAQRSCQIDVGSVAGKRVLTIEGLSATSSHPLQRAWLVEEVPQCGYCQSGQIMKAAELLAKNPKPSRAEIITHMDGNICRCGTYHRIIAAIERAAKEA